MSSGKRWLAVLAAAALAAAPVVVRAPRTRPIAPDGVHTVDEAVDACLESDLHGWDLVDHATQLVHRKYSHYSCYHWWETPAQSFARSRGQSNQYNTVLARVLRALGFHVRTVHAARVRLTRSPWWHSGHTWLEVTVDGRTRDVCASRAENRAGDVHFVPVTATRPFRGLTYLDTTLGLAPIVTALVWKALLKNEALPRWMYRPFDEPASNEGWPASRRPGEDLTIK
ncbi:transglutaminase domain-containing protein [Propionibacteriaceae bacterium Y1923]